MYHQPQVIRGRLPSRHFHPLHIRELLRICTIVEVSQVFKCMHVCNSAFGFQAQYYKLHVQILQSYVVLQSHSRPCPSISTPTM